jgi:hypothetical protein
MAVHSAAFLQAREQVVNRLTSSGVDSPPSMAASAAGPTAVAPEGVSPSSAVEAPATLADPATVKVPATVPVASLPGDRPKAAQNGSGSNSQPPMRGRPPEHQAQMRRMNALTNAVGVIPSLAQKPTTVRAVLRLAAHFERWVASGVVPDA